MPTRKAKTKRKPMPTVNGRTLPLSILLTNSQGGRGGTYSTTVMDS